MKDFYSKVEGAVERWCSYGEDTYDEFFYKTVEENEEGCFVKIKIVYLYNSLPTIIKVFVSKDMRKRVSFISVEEDF